MAYFDHAHDVAKGRNADAPRRGQSHGFPDGVKLMPLQDWKKMVVAPTADLLKPHGFGKSRWTFSAARADAKLLVEFQSSQITSRDQLRVTVNLAIRLDRLDADLTISARDPHWRKRIGQFMTNSADHWWMCKNDEQALHAGEEIAIILEQAALPEMERLASTNALESLWASGRSPGLTDYQRASYLERLRNQTT